MKNTGISFVAAAVICLNGVAASAVAQQSFNQQINSYQQLYTSPQFQSPAHDRSQVASDWFDSGQIVYADQAHYDSTNVNRVVQTASSSGNYYASTNPQPGLAQQKAVQAAQMSFRNHIGGGLGGAKFEGVGWSNQSPQSAVQNCCYWGQRPAAQIGVSKSQDGCWYACVLYN